MDVLLLQAAQPLELVGDGVEGFEHLRLELGLDRGKRHRIFKIVFVEIGFRNLTLFAAFAVAGCHGGLERRRCGRRRRRRNRLQWRWRSAIAAGCAGFAGANRGRGLLGIGAGIGRFEIDNVAEKDFAFVELVAPDDDGLERQRAFAQACDHRFAAGFDALGDGDFAFAGEEFDRAHFAQIHAHGIVGALGGLAGFGFCRRLGRDLDEFAAFALFLFGLFLFLVVGFLGLDDVDAHFVHHRQHVLDLLGGDLLGRHDRIELLIRDVAALLGLLDHLLDGGVGEIEHRQRRIRRFGPFLLRSLGILLRGHHPRPDDLGFGCDGLGGRAFGCHALYLHLRACTGRHF